MTRKRWRNGTILGDVLPLTQRDNLAKPINNEILFSGEACKYDNMCYSTIGYGKW